MAGGAGAGVVHGAGLTRPAPPLGTLLIRTISTTISTTLGQFQQRNIVIVVIVVIIVVIIVYNAVVSFAATVASTTAHVDVRAYGRACVRAFGNQWRLRG